MFDPDDLDSDPRVKKILEELDEISLDDAAKLITLHLMILARLTRGQNPGPVMKAFKEGFMRLAEEERRRLNRKLPAND